ncbi:MAG: VWA domain-containing protein [Verrucomicrobia bacterium]|nr:VWA domain-containing protein [Verrucomicrobiota bacterium]MBV8483986.1 VWA domain-containing protein [Verrucomicrobiota bacterium]
MPTEPDNLERAVVRFCRCARANGLGSGRTTLDCLQALRIVQTAGVAAIEDALRSVLCSSKQDWDLFAKLFALVWEGPAPTRVSPKKSGKNRFSSYGLGREQTIQKLFTNSDRSDVDSCPDKAVSGASLVERLTKTDFALIPAADLAKLERLSVRLLRRMSYRISRRLRLTERRGVVDLRRTIRRNLLHGGELIELRHKKKRRQRAKLVLLLDVSDSMNPYSLFLLKFAYALKQCAREVSAFIFSTNLIDIEGVLNAKSWSDAMEKLSEMTTGWYGGTKIGGSLQSFNRRFGARLLTKNSAVIILSDGWDTEAPDSLVNELRKIKNQSKQLIWLNPLLGLPGYEPVTRGMSAALPYIDVFAPAHNLESLLQLERHLKVA